MPIAIDEVVGEVESDAPTQREGDMAVQEPKSPEPEKIRQEMRRLEQRSERLQAS
jgi:hypothetical protein